MLLSFGSHSRLLRESLASAAPLERDCTKIWHSYNRHVIAVLFIFTPWLAGIGSLN